MNLRQWLNGGSSAAVALVASIAPWIAPLPTAWLVYDRTITHLGWPFWVAVAAGVTLELLGVAILATTLELYNYNRNKLKSHPKAAMWLPALLVGLYVVTAELLTVALDIIPALAAPLAPALFPILSVAAFALLAIRAEHERRLTEIATKKADAKAERARKKAERVMQQREQDATPMQQWATMTKAEQVKRLHDEMPHWTRKELAQEAGCSASTVTRALQSGNHRHEEDLETVRIP